MASETTLTYARRSAWPHLGAHDDSLRIRYDGYSLCIEFRPMCPLCKRSKHPHVTRSGYGSGVNERHCNYCKVRWEADWQPFCSSYGEPGDVGQFIRQMVTRNVYAGFSD